MTSNSTASTTSRAMSVALAPLVLSLLVFSTGAAAAKDGLDVLAGSWRGSGTIAFEDGKTDSINCNGYYKGDGGLSIVILCKGSSTKFELRSKLDGSGDKVSGTWEERTYNASGDASGTASAGKLNVRFSGSLSGGLAMKFSSSSQSVSVSVDTKGAGIKGVQVNLQRD